MLRDGEHGRAQAAFQCVVEKTRGLGLPEEAEAHEGIARCCAAKAAVDRAAAEFAEALRCAAALRDPHHAVRRRFSALVGRARMHIDAGSRTAALRDAADALLAAKGHPEHSEHGKMVVQALELKGDALLTPAKDGDDEEEEDAALSTKEEEALAAYQEAIERARLEEEDDESGFVLLRKCGDVLVALGRAEEAVDIYEREAESPRMGETERALLHHEAGSVLCRLRRFRRALRHLEAAMELTRPEDSDYENVTADVQAARDGVEAKGRFKRCCIEADIAQRGSNAKAEADLRREALNAAALYSEELAKTEPVFSRCEALFADDPRRLFDLFTDWGEALSNAGRHSEAVALYEKQWRLVEMDKGAVLTPLDTAVCLCNYADAQADTGNASKSEIVSKFSRALEVARKDDVELAIHICNTAAEFLKRVGDHAGHDRWTRTLGELELIAEPSDSRGSSSSSPSPPQKASPPPHPVAAAAAAAAADSESPDFHRESSSSDCEEVADPRRVAKKRPRESSLDLSSPMSAPVPAAAPAATTADETAAKRREKMEELRRRAAEEEQRKKELKQLRDSDLDEHGRPLPCLSDDFVIQDLPVSTEDDIVVLDDENDAAGADMDASATATTSDAATLAVLRARTGKAWRQRQTGVPTSIKELLLHPQVKKPEPAPHKIIVAPIVVPAPAAAPSAATTAAAADPSIVITVACGNDWKLKMAAPGNMTIADLVQKAVRQYEDSTSRKPGVGTEFDLVLDDAILSRTDRVADLLKAGDDVILRPRAITAATPGISPSIKTALSQKSLVVLHLESQRIDDKSFAALCTELPSCSLLHTIDLAATGITRARMIQLAPVLPRLPSLAKLSLAKNPLGHLAGNEGHAAVASLFRLPALQRLDISNASLKPDFLQHLGQHARFSTVKSLDLSGNLLCAPGPELLGALGGFPLLEELTVEQAGISGPWDGCGSSSAKFSATLRFLSVGQNRLGDDGARCVAAALHETDIRHLDAHSCAIGAAGCRALLSVGAHFINLDGNGAAGIAMVPGIREGAAPGKLSAIRVSRCGLGAPGLAALLRSVPSCPTLRAISAEGNASAVNGQLRIVTSGNPAILGQLAFLDLSHCGIGKEEAAALYELWASTHSAASARSLLPDSAVLVFGERSALQQHTLAQRW